MQFQLFKYSIPLILLLVLTQACSEKGSVRETCSRFMQGRMALEKGDSTILKEITEDSLFTLLMLHERYAQIIDAPVIGVNLNIYPKEVEVKENCATCLMSSEEYYLIQLCKYDGKWKVEGENGNYPTAEKIRKARKKLADYKVFLKEKPATDSVLSRLNTFFDGAKIYFTTQEKTILEQTCDEATIDVIERLYNYAMKRTGKEEVLKEMEQPSFLTCDVDFNADPIICKFYNDKPTIEVNFRRKDGGFQIIGLNGIVSTEITDEVIEKRYADMLRSLKLVRSSKYRNKIFDQ